jgi:hypothetical protein
VPERNEFVDSLASGADGLAARPAPGTASGLLGLGAAIAVLGVARAALREIVRGTGFRIFVVAYFAVAWFAPGLGAIAGPEERLRLLASYGLGIPAFLLAIATIAWSTSSLAHEIERRAILHVGVKPAPGYVFLLGKWCGVVALGLGLWIATLGIFGSRIVWASFSSTGDDGDVDDVATSAVRSFARTRSERPPDRPRSDAQRLEREVAAEWISFSRGVPRDDDPTEDEVAGVSVPLDARRLLETRVRQRLETVRVPAGTKVDFVVRGLRSPQAAGDMLLCRFRCRIVPWDAMSVETAWRVGDRPIATMRVDASAFGSVEIPADLVQSDGTLVISVENLDAPERAAEVRFVPDSFEVLEVDGSLAGSLVASIFIVGAQLGFLAALGLLGAAFFTLPTANLLAFTVYVTGLASGFVEDSLLASWVRLRELGLGPLVGFLSILLDLLPDFVRESPVERIADSRSVAIGEALGFAALTLGIRAGVVLAVAAIRWSRRESGASSE